MPSFELTENLRQTIRDLRKKKKKRGDELSKELGKGASYISQIENGKIKEIDFDLLSEIFHKITDLPENEYNNFLNKLLDDAVSHMTKDELLHEKWMHQFNHELRMFPITDSIISFIISSLISLGYSSQEFIDIVNENRSLEGIEITEPNKLNIEVIDRGNGNFGIISSIRFELPIDFLDKIISKQTQTINYINMEGIIFNLFLLLNGNNIEDAHAQTDKVLYDNHFFTIEERNNLIRAKVEEKVKNNENFTFYDVQPTDYDKEYTKLIEDIEDGLGYLRDKDIVYTCKRLKQLSINMHDDLGFTIAIMSAPLSKIADEKKHDFWNKYLELIKSFLPQENGEE
ncbi:MAG: helix-turn-helix domain-containing protein [Roseburia sp.]|nr:helix-turn-helix domain-containing protein [Roseburia sp.]MCM1278340.1 helix-turn-helix domain-containing protein [Robinsoniella sp.]